MHTSIYLSTYPSDQWLELDIFGWNEIQDVRIFKTALRFLDPGGYMLQVEGHTGDTEVSSVVCPGTVDSQATNLKYCGIRGICNLLIRDRFDC